MFEAIHTVFAFAGEFAGAVPLYHGTEMGEFPVESVPDGSIWYPHHFWTGLVIALFVTWYRGDDADTDAPRYARKPVFTVAGAGLAVYGWLFLWHNATSPFWGAAFSLVGTTAAVLSVALSPYWRVNTLGDYREKIAGAWSDAAECVRSGWREAFRCAAVTVGYPVVYPEVVVRWVARRVVSTRTATLIGLLIAYDDAVDHALPVTTPLQAFWVGEGHKMSGTATDWAVTFTRWLAHAVDVFVDVLAGLIG